MALFILIGLLFYISIPINGQKNIYIDSPSINTIIPKLTKKGYSVGAIDRYLISLMGKVQKGWIYIGKKNINRIDFIYHLTSPKMSYSIVTLVPGETTIIFMDQLAKKLALNKDKLLKYYRQSSNFKEAGILADSYNIPKNLKEKGVIRFLLKYSYNRYKKISIKQFGQWDDNKWNRILTIASIIQKEAANKKEMSLVASVIQNRLAKNMRLQMDGTLNYGKYSHVRVTPKRIKNDLTTYNTYKHKGLPLYPVCSVSIDAIMAAIHPAKTRYLYFMKNDKGEHDFSISYKTHLKNIKKKIKELKNKL